MIVNQRDHDFDELRFISSEWGGSNRRLAASTWRGPLSIGAFIEGMEYHDGLIDAFTQELLAVDCIAMRWELPPLTEANWKAPFECVVLDAPSLERPATPQTFAEHYDQARDGVVFFPNLRGDATMIVPTPTRSGDSFPHLLAFLRTAAREQVRAFWKAVAVVTRTGVGDEPCWLSTAGAGVAWLHARLDSRPKYIRHAPYRNPLWQPVASGSSQSERR